jgi:adenylate cyclase
MVSSDVRITAEDNNFTINNRVAAGLSNTLSSVRAASAVFLATMGAVEAGEARTRALEKLFFDNNYDIAAVALLDGGGGGKAPAFTATTPVSKDMNRLEAPV